MSRKIKATYTADPVAGNDPAGDYLVAGDDGDDNPVVLDMDQLAGVMAGKLGIDPPPIDPPVDPDDEDVNQGVITIQDNTLQANIQSISGITYTHHLILRDDDTNVTYPTGGTWSNLAVPALITLTDWVDETFYIWVYNLSTGTTKEILTPDGTSGVTVTPNATAPPVQITDFAINTGNTTASTIECSFSSTTIIDGLTLQYDIVDANTGLLINASGEDVTPGTVTITGLTENTLYNLAVVPHPDGTDLSNTSRKSTSNIDSETTDVSLVTFTVFELTGHTDTLDAEVDTFTVSGSPDRWFWSLNDVTPASNDAGWITPLPTEDVTTITLPSYGTFQVYAWVSLVADPTNIVQGPSEVVTMVESGETDVFSIDSDNSDLAISELTAPSGTITVVRSNTSGVARTVDIQSTDGTAGSAALAGVNYKTLDTTLTFDDVVTSVEVDYDVLLQNIGHDNGVPRTRNFTVSLTNESAGSINPDTGEDIEITIQGSNGFYPDGAIDPNNPPTNLTKLFGTQNITASDVTYDLVEVDAQGANHCFVINHGVSNITIKRFIARNCAQDVISLKRGWADDITITNGLIYNWATSWLDPSFAWNTAVIHAYPNQTGSYSPTANLLNDITVRGIKAIGNGRFSTFQYISGTKRIEMENNYFKNTTNEELPTTRAVYKDIHGVSFAPWDGHLIQIWENNNGGDHVVRGNVFLSKRSGNIGGQTYDIINLGRGQAGSEGDRNFIEFNALWGSSVNHNGSGVGIIMDDISSDKGYATIQYNLCIETDLLGVSFINGVQSVARYNQLYCGSDPEEANQNGQGISFSHSLATNTNEMSANEIMWYQYNPTNGTSSEAIQWTGSSVLPTGWNTQVVMDGTSGNANWSNDGDTVVQNVKAILNNPGIDDGFRTMYASHGCTSGNGTLRWDDSEDELFFAAYGDAEGAAVTINVTPSGTAKYGVWESYYRVASSNINNWIYIVVNPTLVEALDDDMSYRVKVTDIPLMGDTMILAYDQDSDNYINGAWGGTETTTVPVSGAPDVPSGLADTPSDTDIQLDWDDESGSGAESYRVYRNDILIASPTTNTYTDIPPVLLQTYNYEVASASGDSPPVLSAKSGAVASATTSQTGQLDDLDDSGTWTTNNCTVTDNLDGTYTITNLTAQTPGFIYATVTVAAGSVPYDIVFKHQGIDGQPNPYVRGLWVADDSDNPPGGTGDLGYGALNDSTLTEHSFEVTPSDTTFYLRLSVFWGATGEETIYSTPTVNAA